MTIWVPPYVTPIVVSTSLVTVTGITVLMVWTSVTLVVILRQHVSDCQLALQNPQETYVFVLVT